YFPTFFVNQPVEKIIDSLCVYSTHLQDIYQRFIDALLSINATLRSEFSTIQEENKSLRDENESLRSENESLEGLVNRFSRE
ncbi:5814_t:CDS:1, partial [Acaulospora morrowiae]